MKVETNEPVAKIRGKICPGLYARVLNGEIVVQHCPKRTKPATEAQLRARREFAEKYAGKH